MVDFFSELNEADADVVVCFSLENSAEADIDADAEAVVFPL